MKRQAVTGAEARRNKKLEAAARLESDLHWKRVLESEAGRYVLLEVMDWCSTFRTLPVDPQLLQRSAGVQTAGHHILDRIAEVAPGYLGPMLASPYIRRQHEERKREAEDAARKQTSNPPDMEEDPGHDIPVE